MRCVCRQDRVYVNRQNAAVTPRTSEKRRSIQRFRCQGELHVTLDTATAMCSVTCIHLEDHDRPSWRENKFPLEELEFLDKVAKAGMRTADVYRLLRMQDHIDLEKITRAQVVGDVEISLKQFQKGREFPTWWVKFRKRWVDLAERDPSDRGYYVTDVSAWSCSCPAFVSAKYLLCKHLVLGYKEQVSTEVPVFLQTYSRFEPPFYVFQCQDEFFSRQTMSPESDPWYIQAAFAEAGFPEDPANDLPEDHGVGTFDLDENEDPANGLPEDHGVGLFDLNEAAEEIIRDENVEAEVHAEPKIAGIARLLAELNVGGKGGGRGGEGGWAAMSLVTKYKLVSIDSPLDPYLEGRACARGFDPQQKALR
ncbi:hypothetical protein R1sor_018783 [Riccia sorocarpa]|uniref:SWIM-type domain-containing protein n=1 Tax=Riccia sorocarpa TaxID=122646 RepID=A0ABD3IB75_9MARC